MFSVLMKLIVIISSCGHAVNQVSHGGFVTLLLHYINKYATARLTKR